MVWRWHRVWSSDWRLGVKCNQLFAWWLIVQLLSTTPRIKWLLFVTDRGMRLRMCRDGMFDCVDIVTACFIIELVSSSHNYNESFCSCFFCPRLPSECHNLWSVVMKNLFGQRGYTENCSAQWGLELGHTFQMNAHLSTRLKVQPKSRTTAENKPWHV